VCRSRWLHPAGLPSKPRAALKVKPLPRSVGGGETPACGPLAALKERAGPEGYRSGAGPPKGVGVVAEGVGRGLA
jgi:hypothetical protein